VKSFLRFHTSAPFSDNLYDVFAIRRFFQDAEKVASWGFKKQKTTSYYYHPKMQTEHYTAWFNKNKNFEMTFEKLLHY
jgi:hypothetical protein